MTTPDTPTRADVLRESQRRITDYCGCLDCAECVQNDLAEEVLRLRGQRDAMIAFARNLATNYDHDDVAHRLRTPCRVCDAETLLAALREGGDDGR